MSPFHNGEHDGSPTESPQLDSLSLNMLGDLLKDLGQLSEKDDVSPLERPIDIAIPVMHGPPPTTVHPRESSAGSGSSAEGNVASIASTSSVYTGGRWGAEVKDEVGSQHKTPPTPPRQKRLLANGEPDPNEERPKGAPAVDLAKFRTKVCKNYSTGQPCQFGDRCAFAHGLYQVRSNLDPNPVLAVYGPQGKKKQQEAKKQAQAQAAASAAAAQQAQLLQQAQLQQLQSQLLRPGMMPHIGAVNGTPTGLNPNLPFTSLAGLPLSTVMATPHHPHVNAAAALDDKLFIDQSGCTWFV